MTHLTFRDLLAVYAVERGEETKTINEDFSEFATWSVDLWITNVQSLCERKQVATPSCGWNSRSAEAFVSQVLPEGTPGLTTWDYDQVDWQRISDDWNSSHQENRRDTELRYANA